MSIFVSLVLVFLLVALPLFGAQSGGIQFLFGVIIPYIAILVFLAGFLLRIINWAKSPVPFKIPTTCGQEKSLPWIKQNNLESPSNTRGLLGRMFFEIFFFRSLFRNTRSELKDGPKIVYGSTKWLWAAGLAFHYSFLIIFIRHFKLFVDPTPGFVKAVEFVDGFLQVGLPIIFMTDAVILIAVTYLFLRRIIDPKLRYMSMLTDYFPLFLILGIAITGIFMRYFTKIDLVSVKEMAMGLLTFQPTIPEGIGSLFFTHLFLVCVLLIYFPFSKLMHMGGIFMSPTRNMVNDNRIKRHENPWNYDVKTHTYEEYEDEFRDLMRDAGMPLEKDNEKEKK